MSLFTIVTCVGKLRDSLLLRASLISFASSTFLVTVLSSLTALPARKQFFRHWTDNSGPVTGSRLEAPVMGPEGGKKWGPSAPWGRWRVPSTLLPWPRAPPRLSHTARRQTGTRAEKSTLCTGTRGRGLERAAHNMQGVRPGPRKNSERDIGVNAEENRYKLNSSRAKWRHSGKNILYSPADRSRAPAGAA